MTFWNDLKNGLIGITGIKGAAGLMGDVYGRITKDEDLEGVTGSDSLSEMADASIRGKSELFGIVPNIVGMPLLGDLYSPGFGQIVRRRVQSAYQANLLSPMDYIAYNYRYPEKELDTRFWMSELGFDKNQEEIMHDLYKYYPNAPDFVRFGVREVFKPEIVKKYGYDDDFPKEIIPHMEKAGLSEDVMQWFWRAHWEMPSFYNIREARWRDLITDTEVDEWLTINDYAPYWRDTMVKIMYTPYTRVDIRRMYDTGVVDRDEVKRTYKDIGYDEEHAENLTRYTVINSDKTKDVLSTYTKAYERGLITQKELEEKMREMEYSDTEIKLRIEMLAESETVERSKRGLTLTTVKNLYKKGLTDSSTLEDQLITLNYSDDAVKYMKLLIVSESTPHKAWTTEIKKGYQNGVLSRDETIARLTGLGYSMESIDLSLALIEAKMEE